MIGKKTQDKHAYMTETPVPKLITSLAIPTIISMLVTGLYNSADTYFAHGCKRQRSRRGRKIVIRGI